MAMTLQGDLEKITGRKGESVSMCRMRGMSGESALAFIHDWNFELG